VSDKLVAETFLYLTTHKNHYRQTSLLPVGFEPTISAGEQPQTYALDRATPLGSATFVTGKIELFLYTCGPGSSVGTATGYGLNGPGIESRWGRDFPHLSRPVLGPTQPDLYRGGGGVESGRGVTLTSHPS
jgi:hypothetical protein